MKSKKIHQPSVSHGNFLMEDLKNTKTAIGYLNQSLYDGDEAAFLLALHHVAQAQGGLSQVARMTKIHRVSLHRILSKTGNPRMNNLSDILHALGMKLAIVEENQRLKRAA